MNKIVHTIILTLFSTAIFAQDKMAVELKLLLDDNKHEEIISKYGKSTEDYSARSLYYIGLAYYMKADDANCLQFVNRSIEKDSTDAEPLQIKGLTLLYMGKFDEATLCIQKALVLKPDFAQAYSALGDVYYAQGKKQAALEAFEKATLQPKCPERPYSMIAQIYSDQQEDKKTLAAYYEAKNNISKQSPSYVQVLYNIGLLESMQGNYDKAEVVFLELLQLSPDDYPTYARLIQIYHSRKEYEKAQPYKDKLYKAHDKGLLKDNLTERFCFEQFTWKEYHIQAFERFQNKSEGKIYNKHIFYVADKDDNVVMTVQTEYSPISVELGGPKYLLCGNKGSTHFNAAIGYNDDLKHDKLKENVIKILERYLN